MVASLDQLMKEPAVHGIVTPRSIAAVAWKTNMNLAPEPARELSAVQSLMFRPV
jgi:hypothetical protein